MTTFTPEQREAAVESRRRRTAAINHSGRATDRRRPGEVRSLRDSILSFCSECITSYGLDCGGAGGVAAAIRGCTCTACHLYPWRNGPLDEEA